MADRVLVSPSPGRKERVALAPDPQAGWRMVAVAGLILGGIGWIEILLLWLPPRFESPEWEFGTASSTYDALPLATIGLALVVAGAVALGWRNRLRFAAWFAAAVAVVLMAVLVLFLLDVPLAWKGVPPASLTVLKKAIAKTVVLAVAYVTMYAVLGLALLRRLRAVRTPT